MALRVWLWLLSLSVLWGGSFFFAKVALGELGRCEEAAQIQEQAMEAARRLGAEEAVESRLTEALERYRQGPPCRPPLDAKSED